MSPLQQLRQNGIGIPMIVIMMLTMMILPVPAFLLDMFFTFNIVLSLIILLAAIYCLRPLDFSIFPSILLVATLLRLSLNVASTRVVLLDGHTGTDAAGQVVESFGSVVIGGNYAVGLVVFAILVIINFVVVTKGAGRISEVSARFTLDAMPGKQMAIDADLNSGLVTQDEAKKRRKEIAAEADFYGAMDGAGKFVRGDAIAGILILFINLIGGLVIGMAQHDMSAGDAMHNYALLTIGDGLVAQVPSLLLSTAAALLVTRVSSAQDMGGQIIAQLFANPKALVIAALILGLLGIIPGMPHLVFLGFAAVLGGLAYYVIEHNKQLAAQARQQETHTQDEKPKEENKELDWEDVNPVDPIGLEIGYRLIPMVDKTQGGQLMDRVKGVRKKLSQELGFLIPSVHIRDNLDLTPNTYRLMFMGVCAAEAEIHVDKFLAINPGQVYGKLEGIAAKDPAFDLDAVWIDAKKREQAQSLGYTVVDASTVIATHLSQLIQTHAAALLGHEETQQLLDKLAKQAPKLVEELVPNILPLGVIVQVLQQLLTEKIPIVDIRTIAESLAEAATKSKEIDSLVTAVRINLGRLILQNIQGHGPEVDIITLHPDLEQILQQALEMNQNEGASFEPGLAERLQTALQQTAHRQDMAGQTPILAVQPLLRRMLARFTRVSVPSLHVLSYDEIPDDRQVKVIGTIGA